MTSLFLQVLNIHLLPTCACSSPLSLSSAVSPLFPRVGAAARLPGIPDVDGMRRTGGLPERAWKDRTATQFVPPQRPSLTSALLQKGRSRVTFVCVFIHAGRTEIYACQPDYRAAQARVGMRPHPLPSPGAGGGARRAPGGRGTPIPGGQKGERRKSDRMK